jgi:hypothetical protein
MTTKNNLSKRLSSKIEVHPDFTKLPEYVKQKLTAYQQVNFFRIALVHLWSIKLLYND